MGGSARVFRAILEFKSPVLYLLLGECGQVFLLSAKDFGVVTVKPGFSVDRC